MIRHLLILGLPELTRTDLDRLLIRLLDFYEEACSSMDTEERLAWFQEACRILDACFAERGHERLRFMCFKAQDL